MSDEDTVAVDTSTEGEEATESNEDSVEETQEDTVVEEKEEVVPKKQYNQVFSRAKKAEEENKLLKKENENLKANPPINSNPQLPDELKLIARGLSDEEIDKAKVIAKGAGITLQEAIKDPLFLSYQATLKEERRKEKAKLGASKGSGESADNTLIKPEMTRDEHQEAFKKVMGL